MAYTSADFCMAEARNELSRYCAMSCSQNSVAPIPSPAEAAAEPPQNSAASTSFPDGKSCR